MRTQPVMTLAISLFVILSSVASASHESTTVRGKISSGSEEVVFDRPMAGKSPTSQEFPSRHFGTTKKPIIAAQFNTQENARVRFAAADRPYTPGAAFARAKEVIRSSNNLGSFSSTSRYSSRFPSETTIRSTKLLNAFITKEDTTP